MISRAELGTGAAGPRLDGFQGVQVSLGVDHRRRHDMRARAGEQEGGAVAFLALRHQVLGNLLGPFERAGPIAGLVSHAATDIENERHANEGRKADRRLGWFSATAGILGPDSVFVRHKRAAGARGIHLRELSAKEQYL